VAATVVDKDKPVWSGGEVESRATVSQVVVDDRCRRSATSARRVVVDPCWVKQQVRWRAPMGSDLRRGRSDRQPLYRGQSDHQPLYGGRSDHPGSRSDRQLR
jgi:hypothetical protein